MRSSRRFLFCTLIAGLSISANAQWCVPTTLMAYNSNMPGITRFQLNGMDRISPDLESISNNYVFTGMSTTLVPGQTYPVTINFTVDALICPDMNLRIWADLDQDGDFDGAGETLLSVDHIYPPSYSANITIPSNTIAGSTRLRVSAKMSSLGGHILPTPCDLPADPYGYHGEMEDYDVLFVAGVGIHEHNGIVKDPHVRKDLSGQELLYFELLEQCQVVVNVLDAKGGICWSMPSSGFSKGSHYLLLPPDLRSANYLAQLVVQGHAHTIRYAHLR